MGWKISRIIAIAVSTFALCLSAAAQEAARADRWLKDVEEIASDANQGRRTGSEGHLRAVDYVERRFVEIGLKPAGDGRGFRQQVALEEQIIDYGASAAWLVGPSGDRTSLALGSDMIIGAQGGPRPAKTDAPLVFIGYGLHLPAYGHDDFESVDLRGKVAVVLGGGPTDIPAPVKAHQRRLRAGLLKEAGAIGLITLTSPRQIEIPWGRQVLLAKQGEMFLADPALRDMPDDFFLASFSPDASEKLFTGTDHDFALLAKAADASAPLPVFDLRYRLTAKLSVQRHRLSSPNLVARIEGSDPDLKAEHVVLSAHLDHVGIDPEIDGDAIYNGAMDDGSGVASVLDIATRLAKEPRPKRSIVILIVTAEEPGLLGSAYFVRNPTVPRHNLVANLNFDTLLPLWPLTEILVQGDGESSLGDNARLVASRQGLLLVPDPLPNRSSFVRTDQYSFVRAGIPALALKFGFTPGSEAFRLEHDWRANRYHAPSDDIRQPGILPAEAIKLDDYAIALAADIANDVRMPAWREESIFAPAVAQEKANH